MEEVPRPIREPDRGPRHHPTPEEKGIILLHYAGAAVQEIFETLPNPPEPTEATGVADWSPYTQAVEKLSLHFNLQKNIRV